MSDNNKFEVKVILNSDTISDPDEARALIEEQWRETPAGEEGDTLLVVDVKKVA